MIVEDDDDASGFITFEEVTRHTSRGSIRQRIEVPLKRTVAESNAGGSGSDTPAQTVDPQIEMVHGYEMNSTGAGEQPTGEHVKNKVNSSVSSCTMRK